MKCPTYCGKKRIRSEVDLTTHLINDCKKHVNNEVGSLEMIKSP